jgi:uncharacterized cupin superfamily protein
MPDRLSPIIIPPDEGTRFEARGSEMCFKALASSGAGRFSLMERTLPPGGRMPPAHRHVDCDEAYYVLDGEVTFVLDSSETVGSTRWWVLVPGGASHTFGNRSSGQARVLVLHAPPLDAYFAALHELWHRGVSPTTEEELALMARHGMEPA